MKLLLKIGTASARQGQVIIDTKDLPKKYNILNSYAVLNCSIVEPEKPSIKNPVKKITKRRLSWEYDNDNKSSTKDKR